MRTIVRQGPMKVREREARVVPSVYESAQEHFRFLEWKREQGLEMTPSMYDEYDDELLYLL